MSETLAADPTATVTARSILESDGAQLDHQLMEADALADASGRVRTAGGSIGGSGYQQVADLVRGFLEIDVTKVMLAGWVKYKELKVAGAHTRGTAEVEVVELTGRDLQLTRHPRVDVEFAGQPVAHLIFEIGVNVHVDKVDAVVRNGALVELTSGKCEITVSLSLSGTELLTRTKTVDPHFVVSLGEGIVLTDDEGA